jgi:predicted SAM-dependent methyltransferase
MIPQDKVRKGVGLCIPLSGRPVPSAWAFTLAQLDPPINFNHFFHVVEGKPVDEARNMMCSWAIENKLKYMFFLDEDTVPPTYTLRRLIFMMENNPQMDVLGGVYFSKCETPAPLVFKEAGMGSYWDWKVGELFQVWGIGMGCTLINTQIFDKLQEPYFLTIKGDASVDGVSYGEAWTEDLYFCEKVKKAGGRIFADSSIICDHYDVNTGKVYTLPPNSKPAIRRSSVGNKKIIDLGCGQVATVMPEGTPVRVDLSEYVNADYRCDVRALPFANESFDIAYSSHTLEHFPREGVSAVLDEWLRILKPGGELRLVVPDLAFAAKHILDGSVDKNVMNVLYGAQDYRTNYHRTGFTKETLSKLLCSKGLRINRIWTEKPYNLYVSATKLKTSGTVGDAQGRQIAIKALPPKAQEKLLKAPKEPKTKPKKTNW